MNSNIGYFIGAAIGLAIGALMYVYQVDMRVRALAKKINSNN